MWRALSVDFDPVFMAVPLAADRAGECLLLLSCMQYEHTRTYRGLHTYTGPPRTETNLAACLGCEAAGPLYVIPFTGLFGTFIYVFIHEAVYDVH